MSTNSTLTIDTATITKYNNFPNESFIPTFTQATFFGNCNSRNYKRDFVLKVEGQQGGQGFTVEPGQTTWKVTDSQYTQRKADHVVHDLTDRTKSNRYHLIWF